MDESIAGNREIITLESRPTLQAYMKFRHDRVRNRWVILGPERILTPNKEATEVLHLCDGERTVADIAVTLAQTYDADADVIVSDIVPLLQALVDTGVLRS